MRPFAVWNTNIQWLTHDSPSLIPEKDVLNRIEIKCFADYRDALQTNDESILLALSRTQSHSFQYNNLR